MVNNANSRFLQTFLWEKFLSVASKLVEVPVVVMEIVERADASKMKRTDDSYKLRA